MDNTGCGLIALLDESYGSYMGIDFHPLGLSENRAPLFICWSSSFQWSHSEQHDSNVQYHGDLIAIQYGYMWGLCRIGVSYVCEWINTHQISNIMK